MSERRSRTPWRHGQIPYVGFFSFALPCLGVVEITRGTSDLFLQWSDLITTKVYIVRVVCKSPYCSILFQSDHSY